MVTNVSLRCTCGKLRGTLTRVSPDVGTRLVCYCGDCQAFARFLERPEVMDVWGGTDIFQIAPNQVQIDQDDDALACVRLSDRGMYRWYCAACKTPVGNTLGAGVPFVGLIHAFMDLDSAQRDEVLGRSIGSIQTKTAKNGGPPHAETSAVRVMGRSMVKVARWLVTRAGHPSPFFDHTSKAPRAQARVLAADARKALDT